jgi:hypothetical protein
VECRQEEERKENLPSASLLAVFKGSGTLVSAAYEG